MASIGDALDSPIIRPNIAVFGQQTWTKLRRHKLIVQAINEQGAASEEVSASIEAVAQLSEKYRTELDSSLAALNDTARLAETMKSVTDRFRI